VFREGARTPLHQIVAFTLQDADELPAAQASGKPASGPLTSRENEIAALVAQGLSNREVAYAKAGAECERGSHQLISGDGGRPPAPSTDGRSTRRHTRTCRAARSAATAASGRGPHRH
jgi:hypothetical protein